MFGCFAILSRASLQLLAAVDERSGLSYLECCKEDFLVIPLQWRDSTTMLERYVVSSSEQLDEYVTKSSKAYWRKAATSPPLIQTKERALYNNDHLLSWCMRPDKLWTPNASSRNASNHTDPYGAWRSGVCAGLYPPEWDVDARPAWFVASHSFAYDVNVRFKRKEGKVWVTNMWKFSRWFNRTLQCDSPDGDVALHHINASVQKLLNAYCQGATNSLGGLHGQGFKRKCPTGAKGTCSGRGTCAAGSGTCRCAAGWGGVGCEEWLKQSLLQRVVAAKGKAAGKRNASLSLLDRVRSKLFARA